MNPVCARCGTRNDVLKDICLKCKWHILKERPATSVEMEDCLDAMDCSIAELEVFNETDVTRER